MAVYSPAGLPTGGVWRRTVRAAMPVACGAGCRPGAAVCAATGRCRDGSASLAKTAIWGFGSTTPGASQPRALTCLRSVQVQLPIRLAKPWLLLRFHGDLVPFTLSGGRSSRRFLNTPGARSRIPPLARRERQRLVPAVLLKCRSSLAPADMRRLPAQGTLLLLESPFHTDHRPAHAWSRAAMDEMGSSPNSRCSEPFECGHRTCPRVSC